MLKKLDIPTHGSARIFPEEEVLNAVTSSDGTIMSVSRLLGADNHLTKKNIRYYDSTIHAFSIQKSVIIDIAENAMVEAIKNGDASLIKFALERLKPEQYGNSGISIDGEGNNIQINILLPDDADEDLAQIGNIGK